MTQPNKYYITIEVSYLKHIQIMSKKSLMESFPIDRGTMFHTSGKDRNPLIIPELTIRHRLPNFKTLFYPFTGKSGGKNIVSESLKEGMCNPQIR